MVRQTIPIPGRPVTISGQKLDGAIANLLSDLGQPVMVYDPSDGTFRFLRADDGVLVVAQDDLGDAVNLSVSTVTSPGILQTLITTTVPAGKIRKPSQIFVSCPHAGIFTLFVDSVMIASGRTNPAKINAFFPFSPRPEYPPGAVFELKYKAASWCPANDIEAFFFASDITP